MEQRQRRIWLFNELMDRTGYLSRDDLAEDLWEQFGLRLSGPQISNRLRADRRTSFTEQEFLAIVSAFTCHFNYETRITAFEALLFWGWSTEISRGMLPQLRRIWAEAEHDAEFSAAYVVYTCWELYSGDINWFNEGVRQDIDDALKQALRQREPAVARPIIPVAINAAEMLDQMGELLTVGEHGRVATLYQRHGQYLLSQALSTGQTRLYYDLSMVAAHHFSETGDQESAHQALENGTDLAFTSSAISDAQRTSIQPFLQNGPDLLKARVLLYQSYGCVRDRHTLHTGLLFARDAYEYYRAQGYAYGETDALNRIGLYQRKLGNHAQSLWQLAQARDAALRIRSAAERDNWLTVLRAAECYTAFQFISDKQEIYEAYRALSATIRTPFAQLDYQFTLAVMAYQMGDAEAARRSGWKAGQQAKALQIEEPFSESERQWREIVVENGW